MGKELTTPSCKGRTACNEMFHRYPKLDGYFGTTYETEKGHEVWNVEYYYEGVSKSFRTGYL
jgi:hypothetical protein